MFEFVNVILGLLLLISVVIIIIRKIIIGIKGTDSGAINIALIVICLVGVICCLSVFLGIFKISDFKAIIDSKKFISNEEIDISKQEILKIKTSNIKSLIVGYISLSFDYIIYKIIDKKNKQEQLKEKNHWNWDKLK